ncbi:Hypothetical protein TES1_0725 [Thermococcus paralvinellae]|uniref:Flavinylation-associated cytochrome domain-containing protein n=2 Tax=Thermococcus paralvinellae TaxID=582419 RepID=W0I237_9EURY|nr:Hypothetical protein TES1_0725 [Thermococcus paralvinellae]
MKASAWLRGTVDLVLTVVFILVAISGIALYQAPPGRVADAIGWTFLGATKDTWETVHTYLGFVMIGLVAIHLVVGFNSMIVMLRSAFKKSRVKVAGSLVLIGLVLVGGYFAFAALTAEEETTYETTSSEGTSVTTVDNTTIEITGSMLKSLTLEQLAKMYDVDPQKLVEILKADYNIEAQPTQLLETIEINNELDREQFKEILAEAIAKAKQEGG